jgi:hypothetical protein
MILAEQIIAELLRNKGVGSDPIDNSPWPVFIGRIPTDPDNCIGVQRDIVPTEGRIHRIGTVGQEGIQIRVRHREYQEAQKKILEIAQLLDEVRREQVSYEAMLYSVDAISQPIRPLWIGPDPNSRSNFVLNCTSSIRKVN